MESTLSYREKLLTESLDMINKNSIKMYTAQSEFEGTLNSIRHRKSELVRQIAL